MPDAYKKGTTAAIIERQFRAFYEVNPKVPTTKILTGIGMEMKNASINNTLNHAKTILQSIQHNLDVAKSGSTILRNSQQDDAPDATAIKSSIDQQIQNLSADYAALVQEEQTLEKSRIESKQIKAVMDKISDDKNVLAKGMGDNLARQLSALENNKVKYEANLKKILDKSITVAKHVGQVVQATTGQSLPQAPTGPRVAV